MVLACWGVLLVTRGRVRRAVAGLAVVAALGLLVATVDGRLQPARLARATQVEAARGTMHGRARSFTGWYAAALVAARRSAWSRPWPQSAWCRPWPEMGTQVRRPRRRARRDGARRAPTENIDIWKALDEGRDPTA